MSGSRSSESHAAELRCISVRQAPRRTAASVRSSQASTSTRRASCALKSPRTRDPTVCPPQVGREVRHPQARVPGVDRPTGARREERR